MAPKKHIAHLDLDCFFVSVERIRDKSLIGKPVAVGGSPDGRGVIASASYEARKYGVRSAMPTGRALKLCPGLIVVRGRHGEYGEYSDRLYRRMLDFTPLVERASIDEMYMDFTGCESLYKNDLPGLMGTLKKLVWDEFTLPCTIALASNKYVAKIAAGTAKPAGVRIIPHGDEKAFLAPLSVDVLPGVGPKTAPFLKARGFLTVGDLQRAHIRELTALLGESAHHFSDIANGRGPDSLTLDWERKSISREETFSEDIGEMPRLSRLLHALVEEVCSSLRSYRWKAGTITLKLRYSDFKTLTRAVSLLPTDDDAVVSSAAVELLRKTFNGKKRVRLLGVRLTNFTRREEAEPDLFGESSRRSQMLDAVDAIREKFGDDAIHLGRG
ncbi:MAG TPA: DNA polymerase IV [Bacteroidota bacterium]|nr:DNA polymerase IV [Bacteroidota bacterium]